MKQSSRAPVCSVQTHRLAGISSPDQDRLAMHIASLGEVSCITISDIDKGGSQPMSTLRVSFCVRNPVFRSPGATPDCLEGLTICSNGNFPILIMPDGKRLDVDSEADTFHFLFHRIGNLFFIRAAPGCRACSGARIVIHDSCRQMLDVFCGAIRIQARHYFLFCWCEPRARLPDQGRCREHDKDKKYANERLPPASCF